MGRVFFKTNRQATVLCGRNKTTVFVICNNFTSDGFGSRNPLVVLKFVFCVTKNRIGKEQCNIATTMVFALFRSHCFVIYSL